MKKILSFLLFLFCFFAIQAQKMDKNYGYKIVGRGLSQQGHWIYDPVKYGPEPILIYDSVYYVDANWRQALHKTGIGRVIAGIFGGHAASVGVYYWADATPGGITIFSGVAMPAVLAIGYLIAYESVGDCRWNNTLELTPDQYAYCRSIGTTKPFWDKKPMIL